MCLRMLKNDRSPDSVLNSADSENIFEAVQNPKVLNLLCKPGSGVFGMTRPCCPLGLVAWQWQQGLGCSEMLHKKTPETNATQLDSEIHQHRIAKISTETVSTTNRICFGQDQWRVNNKFVKLNRSNCGSSLSNYWMESI